MKKHIFLLLALFVTTLVSAQENISKNVAAHLKTGNAKELAVFFTPNIDLSLDGDDDIYSKSQAEQMIKKFFNANKPANFEIVHSGKSTNLSSEYKIGTLTSGEEEYRVTFHIKKEGTKYLIYHLIID